MGGEIGVLESAAEVLSAPASDDVVAVGNVSSALHPAKASAVVTATKDTRRAEATYVFIHR